MQLVELLIYIEKRPLMYIKENNIYFLESFIGGFFMCEFVNEIISEDDRKFKDLFYYWLKEKYDFESSVSWSDMIKEIDKREKKQDQIGVFFREFNQFKEEKLK